MTRTSNLISDRSRRKELNEKKKIQIMQKKDDQEYYESYFLLYI